ncbi:uncharacterized protein LOC108221961 [Daucus carota subsp. sativus]|uniref:uncharacterized protein LOC108221961 n=1 Tax=Daucus carota subsp. sativus TaxID=79200 RepID=UPI0007EF323D|nr:PREDICTED: uncharacterized protein LOC108221961 [Daucus carota subsp. sativus]
MMDGQWLKAAMEDDGTLAAEVLVKLLQAPVAPTPPPPAAVVPMKWTVRQPRTKSGSNKRARARGSPTTPLSWTGGSTSLSGGAAPAAAGDGSEQSSRRGAGSKVTAVSEATPSKKSRKKKTTNELKGEEILTAQDNKQIRKTIASIRAKLGKKKSENVLLKKLKANLAAVPSAKPIAGPRAARPVPVYVPVNVPLPMNVPLPVNVVVPVPVPVPEPVTVSLFSSLTEVKGGSDKFVIPDLNLTFVESKDAGASDV